MITIDKVTYRNLQEQVQKNKSDIAAFTNIQFTLNNMGITVLGKVPTEADIPTGTYDYGNAYLVGLTEPYDIYIFTRDDANGSFVNMGPLAIVGPEGPAGPAGQQGENGERGSKIFTGQVSPASLTTTDYIEGDVYIRLTSENSYNGDVYQYKNLTWTKVGNIEGPKGDQGIQGNSPYIENSYWYINGVNTNVKAEGVNGKDGKDGKDGIVFNILGELVNATLLPDPSTKNEYDAYLVGNNTDGYVLYVVIDGAWKKIAFSTGTQVLDGGTPVTTYEVNKLKPKSIEFKSPTQVLNRNDLGGFAIIGTGVYQSQDTDTSYNLDSTTIVIPLQNSNDIAFNINNNKIEAKLTDAINNKLNNSLQKPASAPTSTQVVAMDTANSQTLIPIDDAPTADSANLVTSGGVYTALSNKGRIRYFITATINSTNSQVIIRDFSTVKNTLSAILILIGIPTISYNNWTSYIPISSLESQLDSGTASISPVVGTSFNDNGEIFYQTLALQLRLKLNGNNLEIYAPYSNMVRTKFSANSITSSRNAFSTYKATVGIYGILK